MTSIRRCAQSGCAASRSTSSHVACIYARPRVPCAEAAGPAGRCLPRSINSFRAAACLTVRRGLVPFEEPLDEQVIFQQAAAAAPLQLAERPLIDQFVVHSLIPSDRPAHHQFLDLADRHRRVQPLRADVHAVHDGVAAEQAIRVFQVVQALGRGFVAAVGDEAVGLQQAGRARRTCPGSTRSSGSWSSSSRTGCTRTGR